MNIDHRNPESLFNFAAGLARAEGEKLIREPLCIKCGEPSPDRTPLCISCQRARMTSYHNDPEWQREQRDYEDWRYDRTDWRDK